MPITAPGVHSNLIIHIASDRLVEILLSGSNGLSNDLNIQIFEAVQNYIVNSRRFIY